MPSANFLWVLPAQVVAAGGGEAAASTPDLTGTAMGITALLCFLVGLCAARGFSLLIHRASHAERLARFQPFLPLLYCAPLALLPGQLGFIEDTTSNAHQLALLGKIERFSGPPIDGGF